MKQDCFFNPESPSYRLQLAKRRIDRRRNCGQPRGQINTRRINYHHKTSRDGSSAYVDVSLASTSDHTKTNIAGTLRDKWYIDSGASAHMCNDTSLLEIFEKPTKGHRVSVGTGKPADVVGTGSIVSSTTVSGTTRTVRLTAVL